MKMGVPMPKTNLRNPDLAQQLAALRLLHRARRFFPTARQRELYEALLSAPCPPDDPNAGADRLTLLGIRCE